MAERSGADAVLAAVVACVASARSARVEAYRRSVQPMAVLVQRMIDADVAGVAFSALARQTPARFSEPYNHPVTFDDYKVVLYRQDDGSCVAVPALGGC